MMGKQIQELQPKKKTVDMPGKEINWREAVQRKLGEELMKNLSVAAALVICVAALRSGALPQLSPATDAVLEAVSGDMLLDDQLGKLSFVSSLFPEATLVFGEQRQEALTLSVDAESIVHAWSEQEPYISWNSRSDAVCAVMSGEIMGVYHGNGEEILVHVMGDDGTLVVYGNLADCRNTTGDRIEQGDILGSLLSDKTCVLELRRDGYSVDPTNMLGS